MLDATEVVKNFSTTETLSLFQPLDSADHSFEEIRVLLKNTTKKLKDNKIKNPLLTRVLDDEKISAADLNLVVEPGLKRKCLAMYMNPSKVVTTAIPERVKSSSMILEKPFILPLLLQREKSQCKVFVINDGFNGLYEYDGKQIYEISETLNKKSARPQSLKEVIGQLINSNDTAPGDLASTEEALLQMSEKAKDEKRKKYVYQCFEQLEIDKDSAEKILVLTSSRLQALVKEALNKKFPRVSYCIENFVPDGSSWGDYRDNVEKKLASSDGEWTTTDAASKNQTRSINVQKIEDLSSYWLSHKIQSLFIDRKFLQSHLEKWTYESEMIAFNNWIVDSIHIFKEIHCDTLEAPLAIKIFNQDLKSKSTGEIPLGQDKVQSINRWLQTFSNQPRLANLD